MRKPIKWASSTMESTLLGSRWQEFIFWIESAFHTQSWREKVSYFQFWIVRQSSVRPLCLTTGWKWKPASPTSQSLVFHWTTEFQGKMCYLRRGGLLMPLFLRRGNLCVHPEVFLGESSYACIGRPAVNPANNWHNLFNWFDPSKIPPQAWRPAQWSGCPWIKPYRRPSIAFRVERGFALFQPAGNPP